MTARLQREKLEQRRKEEQWVKDEERRRQEERELAAKAVAQREQELKQMQDRQMEKLRKEMQDSLQLHKIDDIIKANALLKEQLQRKELEQERNNLLKETHDLAMQNQIEELR